MADDDTFTGHYEFYAALREAIIAADPAKREALRDAISNWSQCDPENFFWAVGPQGPTMLFQIIMEIETACNIGHVNDGKARQASRSPSRAPTLTTTGETNGRMETDS